MFSAGQVCKIEENWLQPTDLHKIWVFFHNVFVHPAVSKLCKKRKTWFYRASESDSRRPNDIFRILTERFLVVTSFWWFTHEYFGLMARDLLLNGDLACGHWTNMDFVRDRYTFRLNSNAVCQSAPVWPKTRSQILSSRPRVAGALVRPSPLVEGHSLV